ncbi:MAG: SAM-dependent methyltransferase, partial [bacterium]|nr:SAM-dependent methyltransferase [bacterium]
MDIDVDRITELAGEVATHMAGATTMAMVHIGDELGLYQAMAGAGPMTADALAASAGCNPRLVTEWLRQQAAVGLVELDGDGDDNATFQLTDEAAAVLAWEVSPA